MKAFLAIPDDNTMTTNRKFFTMRNKSQQPGLLKTLLAITLMVLTTTGALAKPVLIDRIAAVVDNDVIMVSELELRVDTIRKQTPDARLPQLSLLKKQVMERMIEDSIQMQRARQIGLRITDEQLNAAIQRIASQNQMTLEQFRATMESQGVAFSQAREQIRDEMLVSHLQRIRIGERIQITDQDIDLFLASEVGKQASAAEYRLGHILISVPSNASPADLKQAEQEANELVLQLKQGAEFAKLAIAHSDARNALKGGDLGWKKEGQLPGLFAQIAPKLGLLEVSEPIRSSSGFHIIQLADKRGGATQMVTQYRVRHILIQENELRDASASFDLIQSIYQQLNDDPDRFVDLAKEYSDDPGSGSAGGDLGWASPGDMVPEFDNTMKIAAIGEITRPFKTQFGWHLLQVQETRESDVGEDLQRNQVRQLLYSRRFEEELPLWLRKLRSEAYVDLKVAL